MSAPVYNDALFREQFPAFASTSLYPEAALAFAWSMGANWVNQTQASWGIGSCNNPAQLQQAADLMGAVIVYQLYGPGGTASSNATPGPINAAAQGSVNTAFKLPEFGSSAFASLLLASPPYGTMLLALLQIAASVGPYIGSCRPSFVPP